MEQYEQHQLNPDPVNVFRLDKKTNDESGRKVNSWHVWQMGQEKKKEKKEMKIGALRAAL